MEKKIAVRELGQEMAEQAIVQIGLAYHYHNPHCQYNLLQPLAVNGELLATPETAPETACRETPYYQNCRGLVSDIYFNAFGVIIPGTRFPYGSCMKTYARDMLVMQYGEEDGVSPIRDYETFVEELFRQIRPGDIMLARKKNGRHVMLYMGECLGDGKRYVLHDWPVGGGNVNQETGENKREPNGSAVLQTVEDLWYPGNGQPHYEFSSYLSVYLFRPLRVPGIRNCTVPASTLTRLKYPYLYINKEADVSIYDTVIPGQPFQVKVTIASKNGAPFENITVTEFVSDTFVLDRESLRKNGEVSGVCKMVNGEQAVQWVTDVPANGEVELSFIVKPKKKNSYPGMRITLPEGFVDDIPTRAMTFTVGAKEITREDAAALQAAELPETTDFQDLAFVNSFYKKVLSMDPCLPDTVDDFLKETMYVERVLNELDWSQMVLSLKDRRPEDLSEEGKRLQNMRINRYIGGRYVALRDHRNRAIDYLEEYFTPGDVFLLAKGENTTAITDKSQVKICIYLGDGAVVSHSTSGTVRETFEETIGKCIMHNIVIGLRPTLTNT